MKFVTIAMGGWFDSLPKFERSIRIGHAVSLAEKNGYTLRVSGEHWSAV
jgi:hypothetical protein